jgi:hypothetical protein
MSLEQYVQEQTVAIKEQTIVLNHILAALVKNTVSTPATEEKTAPVAKKTAPVAKKTAPVKEEVELAEDLDEGSEVYAPLPKGERDAAYYGKHVRPHLKALGDADHAGLIAMIATFGVNKGTEVDSSEWDKLVGLAKAGLPESDDAY